MSTILKKELKKTNKPHKPLVVDDSPNTMEKKMTWFEEYRCMNTGDLKLAGSLLVERLGKDLLKWAKENDDALRICEFFADKGINQATYQNWLKKDEGFRQDYYHAMRYIGRRREKYGMQKKHNYDARFMQMTMHHFMDEFKHDIEWQASLRNKEDDKGGTKYIVIESVSPPKEKTND
jgi:hypothetical protein